MSQHSISGAPAIVRESMPAESVAPSLEELRLLVVVQGRATIHPLLMGTTLVGSSPDADVHVDAPTVSERHARLHVATRLRVEDCGSEAGTYLSGRRLAPGEIVDVEVGDAIELGDTATLMVQAREAPPTKPRRLWPHGYFEGLMEEECARAARTKSAFTVLRASIAGWQDPSARDEGAAVSGWGQAASLEVSMAQSLRSSDVIAAYAPGHYEVLLVDAAAERVHIVCERLRAAARKNGVDVRIGTASLPRDGRSPQALLAQAEANLRDGTESGPSARVIETVSEIHTTPTMSRLEKIIQRVAKGDMSIMLVGEAGVENELIARRVHEQSERRNAPFVTFSAAMANMAELEGELFGYAAGVERGNGAGVSDETVGALEAADGGTLLLDEVNELPLALQGQLVNDLERGEVLPLGATRPRSINVRIIATCQGDPEAAVGRGQLRAELYNRLNGITLQVPSLRQHPEDIEPLANELLRRACADNHPGVVPSIAPDAMSWLCSYWWPGNYRELGNVMERAALLARDGRVLLEHLPVEMKGATLAQSSERWTPGTPMGSSTSTVDAGALQHADAQADGSKADLSPVLRDELQRIERHRIIEALQRYGGNQTRAARYLGMARNTLMSRMDGYGIPRPRKPT